MVFLMKTMTMDHREFGKLTPEEKLKLIKDVSLNADQRITYLLMSKKDPRIGKNHLYDLLAEIIEQSPKNLAKENPVQKNDFRPSVFKKHKNKWALLTVAAVSLAGVYFSGVLKNRSASKTVPVSTPAQKSTAAYYDYKKISELGFGSNAYFESVLKVLNDPSVPPIEKKKLLEKVKYEFRFKHPDDMKKALSVLGESLGPVEKQSMLEEYEAKAKKLRKLKSSQKSGKKNRQTGHKKVVETDKGSVTEQVGDPAEISRKPNMKPSRDE